MTKISLFNPVYELDNNEQVVLVKNGVTRRGAVGGLFAGAAAPLVSAARLAADTALAASNYFGIATYGSLLAAIAAGEAATAAGGLFSVDDGEGGLMYRERTAAGSVEVARTLTARSLELPQSADRIGARDGGRVQHIVKLASLDDLKAIAAPADGQVAHFGKQAGRWTFRAGDFASHIAADGVGMFVQSNAWAATQGAWVREHDGAASVSWFDGIGGMNGELSDNAAISRVNALLNGGLLQYLYWDRSVLFTDSTLSRNGALDIVDRDRWTLDMTHGQLLLDNLRDGEGPASGFRVGSGSGIRISGPSQGIRLHNPNIKWVEVPTYRSFGDGIFIKGKPTDADCISDLHITGVARVEGAPQAGVILFGVQDSQIGQVEIVNNLADGLHFNACRRVQAIGVKRVDARTTDKLEVGDDACALVNYYHPTDMAGGGASWRSSPTPWDLPEIGAWSNLGVEVLTVQSFGGRANACRVNGSMLARIGSIISKGKFGGASFIADSVETLAGGLRWLYQPSRQIEIGSIQSDGDAYAVLVRSYNATSDAFRSFDIHIGRVAATGAVVHSVQVVEAGGVTIDQLRSVSPTHQSAKFTNAFGCTIHFMQSTGNTGLDLVIEGTSHDIKVLSGDLGAGQVYLSGFEGALEDITVRVKCRNFIALYQIDGLDIDGAVCSGGHFILQGDPASGTGATVIRDLRFRRIRSENSPGYAAFFEDVDDLRGGTVEIRNHNAANGTAEMRGLILNRIIGGYLSLLDLRATATNVIEFEVGGGNATRKTDDLTIADMRLRSPNPAPAISVQGGAHAPTNLRYSGKFIGTSVSTISVDSYPA